MSAWAEADAIRKKHQNDIDRVTNEAKAALPGGASKLKVLDSGRWVLSFRFGGQAQSVWGMSADAVLAELKTFIEKKTAEAKARVGGSGL